MDLLALRTRLRRRVGNPGTAEVSDSDLDENINDAYRDIASKFRHHLSRKLVTISTVAATAKYSLPTDIGAVLHVWDSTNNVGLRKRGVRWQPKPGTAVDGKPEDYIRILDELEFVPRPDAVYAVEVYYSHTITSLSADDDEPELPLTWHVGVLHLSGWYYFTDRGDAQKSDNAYKIWQLWIRDKPVELDEETVDAQSRSAIIPKPGEDVDIRLDFDGSL